MKMRARKLLLGIACWGVLAAGPISAKQADKIVEPSLTAARPSLVVAISVDQFSGDLFRTYGSQFSGGFKRLMQGAVFANGFQAHAATETCPGHATILTGVHPARAGIVANNWFDMSISRTDKRVYCAEDETVAGSSSDNYTVSPVHLAVPTLGDRIKLQAKGGRSVAVSGKDRAAVMMGGKLPDEIWWWGSRGFVSYKGRAAPDAVKEANDRLDETLSNPISAAALPPQCAALVHPLQLPDDKSVGNALQPLDAGDAKGFRATTAFDQAALDVALGLVRDMKLGTAPAADMLAISLSATDYIGHSFGPGGPEMCSHLFALDAALERFFRDLDSFGVRYAVVLTADHGGLDIPEREPKVAGSARVAAQLLPSQLDASVSADLNLPGFVLVADGPSGDYYVAHDIAGASTDQIVATLKKRALASGQVEAVYSRAEIEAEPKPTLPVDRWTQLQRIAASYDPRRSGDAYIVLKPRITPILDVSGYVATHGSLWDYDRNVPMLFWGAGIKSGVHVEPVDTVDIAPTLASLIGLDVDSEDMDGQCLASVLEGTPCPKR